MENKTIQEYFFYVLLCADGTLYGGFTNDVQHRIAVHNAGKGAKYTRLRTRRPVKLLYAEPFADKSAALKAEYAFKHQTRLKKLNYLAAHGVHVS
ncbi:GIY-YIG nuclease family protein [Liquorilactobacillus satsumensis]|uniref:GIY-YIG nuclease family protein n=1 Tax=Liquorilactobacillus satsumensis TaxID=259059 RepID=UPI0039E8FDEE